MAAFIGDLVVKLVKDDESGLWELIEPLSFQSDIAGMKITVPIGMRTDFCSVPRVPFVFYILGDRARMSGTVHDYLYFSHITDRETADKILREMLIIDGVNRFQAQAFYLAVRLGGASHW